MFSQQGLAGRRKMATETLICYDDDNCPHEITVANGFVSRVVSAVFNENHADARRVAIILNRDELATRLAALLGRAVNGPWLEGDLELARAVLAETHKMGHHT